MTADEVMLTEAEREALRGLGQGQVPGAVTHILADRLAQVTARAERAEAQVERVRAVMFDVVGDLNEWDREPSASLGGVSPGGYVWHALCAALAETADSDSEPYVPPQSDEQGALAPGGRDESAGLSEALRAADDLPAAPDEPTWSGLFGIDPTWPTERPDGAGSAGSEAGL